MIARDSNGQALAISGDDRYVADYLYRESFIQLPEDTQRFLRRTAVLDQLSLRCARPCSDTPVHRRSCASLEAANSFLIPLDRRREWYRYHGLFREFLLGELRRVEPDDITKLHLRAADWYEANGSPTLAVEHLLNTSDRDRCARLVAEVMVPAYQVGRISTVQRWLTSLGDSAVEGYPPLAVLAGWVMVTTGQTAEALRWAAIVENASFDLVPADGTASFDSARAMLRVIMCPAGPEQAMTDATLAVAAEPSWSTWRDAALCLSGEAHLLAGDVGQADAMFAESASLSATLGNTDSLVLSETERALLAVDSGRWADAAERAQVALAAIEQNRMHDNAVCVLAFAVAARLSLHRGDLQETNRHLMQAMRSRPAVTMALPFLAVRLRLQLAKVYWALGDQAAARHLLREIDDVLLHRPELGVLVDEVSEFRDILTSSAAVGSPGVSPLTPAELRLLPYLQTHLTIREIGERLFVTRNTVSSEVGSIYRKLGVTSRSEAVRQATAIGLLGG